MCDSFKRTIKSFSDSLICRLSYFPPNELISWILIFKQFYQMTSFICCLYYYFYIKLFCVKFYLEGHRLIVNAIERGLIFMNAHCILLCHKYQGSVKLSTNYMHITMLWINTPKKTRCLVNDEKTVYHDFHNPKR